MNDILLNYECRDVACMIWQIGHQLFTQMYYIHGSYADNEVRFVYSKQ